MLLSMSRICVMASERAITLRTEETTKYKYAMTSTKKIMVSIESARRSCGCSVASPTRGRATSSCSVPCSASGLYLLIFLVAVVMIFLNYTKFCASRSWICLYFRVGWYKRLFGQAHTFTSFLKFGKKLLHSPIFYGMKANDSDASIRREEFPRRSNPFLESSHLVIHGDSKCLKCARRRMNATSRIRTGNCLFNDFGKFASGLDGLRGTIVNDSASNTSGITLLAPPKN